ncbi:Hypothetical_protein [Hexamita inflata]|uniref:Hypothetical_protein n=1 Tax=Hexamita inflata TaxID=28002 RepID=A0AA86Q1Z8_9EUKA|nr:Hypothetical protein HINF_LOCUS35862 [Hexamita inflata]
MPYNNVSSWVSLNAFWISIFITTEFLDSLRASNLHYCMLFLSNKCCSLQNCRGRRSFLFKITVLRTLQKEFWMQTGLLDILSSLGMSAIKYLKTVEYSETDEYPKTVEYSGTDEYPKTVEYSGTDEYPDQLEYRDQLEYEVTHVNHLKQLEAGRKITKY